MELGDHNISIKGSQHIKAYKVDMHVHVCGACAWTAALTIFQEATNASGCCPQGYLRLERERISNLDWHQN